MQLFKLLKYKNVDYANFGREKCRVCLCIFSIFPVLTNSFEFMPTQTLYCKPACLFLILLFLF